MKSVTEIATDHLTHYLNIAGMKMAECEREWVIVDKGREVVLNTLASLLAGESAAAAMIKARIDPAYADHIDKMGAVKQELIEARTKYAVIEFELRVRLSKQYTDNREMNGGKADT